MIIGNQRGIMPIQYKEPAFSSGIYKMEDPEYLYIPLLPAAKPLFEQGFNVFKEQPFLEDGTNGGFFYPAINGFFKEKTFFNIPFLGNIECARITKIDSIITEFDESEKRGVDGIRYEKILELARKFGVICELDGRPVADKLEEAKARGVTRVIADAIEDEPYQSAGMAVIRYHGKEVAKGLQIAEAALDTKEKSICVFVRDMELSYQFPAEIEGIPVERIKGKYPVRYTMQAKADVQQPTLFLGAGALYHLYRAVCLEIPHHTAFITVSGNCLKTPRNMEVPIGTPIGTVLDICKIKYKPDTVVVGGTMNGVSVVNSELPVGPATRGIYALRTRLKTHFECMGCAKCIDACPSHLMPYYLYRLSKAGEYGQCREYRIDSCIECGACSYVCPSRIDLVSYMKDAKKHLEQEKTGEEAVSHES